MATQPTRIQSETSQVPPLRMTMLELVSVVSDITQSEEETVQTVLLLLACGSVQLIGSFKDCRSELLSHPLTLTG